VTTDDEILLARLRDAYAAVDPIPGHVRLMARAAFGWRRPDALLAVLAADSAEGAPAGIRAQGQSEDGRRLLVFTGDEVAVEIEVTSDGADREIVGRLAPPVPANIAVRHPDGEVAAQADPAGHFVVPVVPAGPVSLVFLLADTTSIVTSWVRL
jgi:hypothetical protein